MESTIPAELEERISHYERPGNDPGNLASGDWTILVLTGVVLPVVCLVMGWLVGWQS